MESSSASRAAQEVLDVRLILVGIEGCPVAVKLIEDALLRCAVHLMAGVNERAGLALPDRGGRLGD